MLLRNKGYSLTVLVIAIAVILIITTTAIMSIQNISKDKEISNFMNDLEEVKQFVIEYYAKNSALPVELDADGKMISAELDLISKFSGEGALAQLSEDDVGDYYRVDIEKLGKIHLKDYERDYIINEGTFNVYVTKPCLYQGDYYYTLTPYLLGKDVVVTYNTPFEINIMGNPITWAQKAEILVSIPNVEVGETDGWNFKWLKGSKDASDFRNASGENYFKYGEVITWEENGIYTIYVENPEKMVMTRKVVVSKVDNIPPTIRYEAGEIFIDDAQTGVKNIRCKIKENVNFDITDESRNKHKEYYTMSGETYYETDESLLDKYLWGDEDIRGDTVQEYLKKYEEYYDKITQYNAIMVNASSTSGEKANALAAIKILNDSYPQFAYENRRFPNTEKNIVMYVEDMVGNGAVYSAINRYELIRCQYLSGEVETLQDSKVVINNNATYTNDTRVSLFLQSMYAEYVFLTEVQEPTPSWELYNSEVVNFDLSSGDGEKIVYAFFKDDVGKIVGVYDKIHLDQTKPSNTAPIVTGDFGNLTIISTQTDTRIVNGVETQSGISHVSYGIAEGDSGPYIWYSSLDAIPNLIEGATYRIVTRARDKAGNEQISEEVEVDEDYLANFLITINDGATYTNTRSVNLKLKAENSNQMFITETRNATPTWEALQTEKTFELSETEGEKLVYAYFKTSTGSVEEVVAKIILDTIAPTNVAPTVPTNLHNFTIVSNQVDDGTGIEKLYYGVKKGSESDYTWYNSVSLVPQSFAENTTYIYVTKAIDRAGNEQVSNETTIKTGTEPLEENLEIGDYINIEFVDASYKTDASETGADSQTLITSDVNWRVLNVDESTGEILIVSEGFANADVRLEGILGYMNGPRILDEICSTLYKSDTLGVSARCMTLEDLNKALGVSPTATGMYAYYPQGTSVSGYYGSYEKAACKNTDPRFYVYDSGGVEAGPDENGLYYRVPTATNPVCVTNTYITYNLPTDRTDIIEMLENALGSSSWGWTTTQAEYAWPGTSSFVGYGLQAITTERVGYYSLYSTDNEEYAPTGVGLRPIIVLNINDLDVDIKYTTQTGDSVDDAWNLVSSN